MLDVIEDVIRKWANTIVNRPISYFLKFIHFVKFSNLGLTERTFIFFTATA